MGFTKGKEGAELLVRAASVTWKKAKIGMLMQMRSTPFLGKS